MKFQPRRSVTPQQKMININDMLGNKGIKKQQGTTRVLYDTLPLSGAGEYRFFEEASTRQFPDTNMNSDGNKLGVGGTVVIERAYLSVITKDAVSGAITNVATLEASLIPPLTLGELAIDIANLQVAKQISLQSFDPRFNKSAINDTNNNFEFDTQLVIPPQVEFVFRVRMPTHAAVENTYLRLTIEGAGAIINPRQTL